jgi:hypothetical protein
MNGMNELSRLLATGRAVTPPPQAAQVGLPRLLGALAMQAAPLPVASGALHLWSLAGKWLGVGFAVGLAAAGTASVLASAISTPLPAAVPTSAVNARSMGTATVAGEASIRSNATTIESGKVRPAATPNRSPATSTSAMGTDLAARNVAEELRLMKRAKQELDARRPHLAKVWLSEHAQRFPKGVFALEREALSILIQCTERPQSELASEFEHRHPSSPMVGQLKRQCADCSSGSFSSPTNAPAVEGERIGD